MTDPLDKFRRAAKTLRFRYETGEVEAHTRLQAHPPRAGADYESRLRMALDHGVALPKQAIRFAGDDDLRALLEQWARDRPGQVVEHGPV